MPIRITVDVSEQVAARERNGLVIDAGGGHITVTKTKTDKYGTQELCSYPVDKKELKEQLDKVYMSIVGMKKY
jgi:hypothetical protein